MYRTTEGFHTFTVFKRLTKDEIDDLLDDFKRYERETEEIEIFPTDKSKKNIRIIYKMDNRGVKWLLRFCNITEDFKMYFIEATINPKVLIGVKDYITAANMEHFEDMKEKFETEAKKISPILSGFSSYSPNRIDYCINFHLRDLGINCDPMLVMMLLKRSNIPIHYKERETYSDISHRWISDPASHYLKSGSVTINCYSKYMELQRRSDERVEHGLPPIKNEIMDDVRDLIRFEIQCKYPKVYSMSHIFKNIIREFEESAVKNARELRKEIRHLKGKYRVNSFYHIYDSFDSDDIFYKTRNYKEDKLHDDQLRNRIDRLNEMFNKERDSLYNHPSILSYFLSDCVCHNVVDSYFKRVIMGGDYYTLDHARKIIKSRDFRQSKEDKMIWVLELINEKRGVSKAKASLSDDELESFNRILRALVDEGINPVTIPRGYGVNHIPNLYEAYSNKVINNRIDERRTIERLEEHFEKRKNRKKKRKK